jgi:hypothetical protein
MAINYIEKGFGLHEAIKEAGHTLVQRDGVWISSNDEAVQAIIDAFDPEVYERSLIPPVTRRQMLTALHRAGLLETIKGAVSASGDVELQIAFDESQEFQRDNPFLASMAAALGKSDAEIDAIFALAASL